MIRKFEPGDIQAVMQLWLDANLDAHSFVPPDYWRANFDSVKAMIPQAEVYVSEENGALNGFIGVAGQYIAGLFVSRADRRSGVGTALLNMVKGRHDRLTLSVYEKNHPARAFYAKAGFRTGRRGMDADVCEPEYEMLWEKSPLEPEEKDKT